MHKYEEHGKSQNGIGAAKRTPKKIKQIIWAHCTLVAFVNSRFIVSTGGRQFDDFGRIDEQQKHDKNYFDHNMRPDIQLYLNIAWQRQNCINVKCEYFMQAFSR